MSAAFDNVRVIDFGWIIAVPSLTRYLGDHGAEVIKIESSTYPDLIRSVPPYQGGKPGLNQGVYWANLHANKYGVTLNLKHPKGIEVVKRLVAISDVVVENYIPGTMERLGLGYEELVKVKPDIIMASLSLYGQTGPFCDRSGWGVYAEGMSGFLSLFGWPDRGPTKYTGVIGDAMVPYLSLGSIAAALDYRNRTGKGQHLDLGQLDLCGYLLTSMLLDYNINGRQPDFCANLSESSCPHNAYRCTGDDAWCAIDVSNDEEWLGLCRAMGEPEWSHAARLATFAGRKQNEAELDALVGSWAIGFSNYELTALLQKEGVPAGALATAQAMIDDPQLKHREAVWYMDCPGGGTQGYYTAPFKLSGTPAQPRMGAPRLGQHNEHVYTEVLGMSKEEFKQLEAEGVFK